MATERVVYSADFGTETRWNGYPTQAVVHGIRSVYSSPLMADRTAIGALNLYGHDPDAFDEDSQRAAALFSRLTSTMITAALRHYDEVTLTDHLRAALSSRSIIDQAMGIVMSMQRCGPQEAFEVLRTVSQNRNIPLREIAAELVANTSKPPPSA